MQFYCGYPLMHISSTELNRRPGSLLEAAIKGEPVIIEKAGTPSVVMVSYAHYQELEEAFWGTLAENLEKRGRMGFGGRKSGFLKSALVLCTKLF
jgi:prevent-host-death family protein